MRSVFTLAAAAACAVALAQACTPADVTDASAQACDDYAYAYCSHSTSCSSTQVQLRWGSQKYCEQSIQAQCLLADNAPSSGATSAVREACAQAIPSWNCDDFVSTLNPPQACAPITGALANGSACAVNQQCQTGYCGIAVGSNCGTCAPPPAPGTPCASINCASGDVCNGSPPVCAHSPTLGMPCTTTLACAGRLACVGASSTSMGVCMAPVRTPNAMCTFAGAGCDSYAALACNAMTNTCATARISPPGGPCALVDDQTAYCSLGVCTHGVCVANPPAGAPCNLDGPLCQSGAHCIVEDGGTAGTCQFRGAVACN